MNAAAQALSQRLAALGASGAFATRFAVEADPQLHIEAVGEVSLPVTIHTAHQLCATAQPAMHGYKDQTRLDPRVRDTWEIPASRIRFDSPHWQSVLGRALERIRRDLGVPPGPRFKAELHNLLVYAPGQFFAVHQDSEKTDGMLGTLVVTLPSRFTGGEFVVSHQGQTLRSRSSAGRLGMIAFYADCHHEVRPVKQGYRVVLTYNLIAQGGAQADEVPAQDIANLAVAVTDFWQTPAPSRWTGDSAGEPPDRLVYLLDHEYTQSGLSWARLKGVDATRAAALRRAAERLDAEIFLVLADVHETWSAEDDYQDRGHWDYAEDDEDQADDEAGDPALGELIDSDIELRHWIAPDGSELASDANGVAHGELCFTRSSADCTPFRSEHEGYMGNYGNTVDRWYHRAAVVMWPRERAFVIRARQSPRWAIAQIAGRFEAGEPAQALEWAQRLLPFWKSVAIGADGAALLDATLPVATALDDADTAAALLEPFSLQQLAQVMAPWFVQLLDRRGLAWCGERLRQWATSWQTPDGQLTWLAQTLPALIHVWSTATVVDGQALAAALVEERWRWLQSHVGELQARTGGTTRIQVLASTAPAWLALISGCGEARRADLRRSIIDALLSAEFPLQLPLAVLHAAGSEATDAPSLASVYAHCVRALTTRLAQPVRADDDWSIPPPAGCTGELGETLARFLSAPAERRLEWPLAKERRQVIHQLIDRHELPVRHETRRTGRPYTLVLEKTRALFTRTTAERRQWASELAWLEYAADVFSRPDAMPP
ncbi:MAG: 2OG-Fe(II) oxygenase [Xanthomonadaceae bacterium]|nr:2OG-Fe(II) oxygenase [Xanthomonadaceae bacterium]